ncbi:YybH family protein [Microbulbifer spongiae]|uniref:Nuclear transport factor 2 family protein n=1 Tax=Microbulbifer spongiae TaxID=2944933 RepID=A0ABY9EC78_9GAMM|nr:nuclear transport factor 2 family protein [Microbulbifer sp. MI-G]WKD49683.1 nuclear transport factor 2 family protein [Microbulbifer sp. MI-G]
MPNDHADIAALCQRLGDAHRDKDADAIVDCYAPDAVVYSLAPPLKSTMQCKDIAAWLETWDGPIHVDARDMDMVVGGDLAWVTALNHMTGTKVDGKQVDLWFRSTLCFRKNHGVWKIVHDHASTPFYMDGSLRAAVDLRPS